MTDHEFDDLFARLKTPFDLSDEVQRRQAYQACLTYAQNTMGFTFEANTFLARAAEKLDVPRAVLQTVRAMVPQPENARLLLTYHGKGGPDLTGNSDGLRYLGELCRVLASATSDHEHVHLYANEPPLFGNSYALTLYNEPAEWFDKHGVSAVGGTETDDATAAAPAGDGPPRRAIAPVDVEAVGLFGASPYPPFLLLTAGRLYRVQKWAWFKKQNVPSKTVPSKTVRNDKGRMVVWTLLNDAGKKVRVAFDLDDPDVRYFSVADLQQI